MNINKLKSIIKVFENSTLTKLCIEEESFKVNLEKEPSVQAAANIILPAAIAKEVKEAKDREKEMVNFNQLAEIKSPIVGVFYLAPSPDEQPFVEIGSYVRAGDVLCIVEAMKVMNEITAETDGEIVDICAQSGQLVEYSQVLFKIK